MKKKLAADSGIPAKIVADDPKFIPMYQTAGSAGADLVANIPQGKVTLLPGHIATVDCGFKMALEPGWEAQVRSRSGLAKKGLQVTNSPGTIDSDYRGRVMVVLNNAGKDILVVEHGQRIAQMVLQPVYRLQWNVVEELDETDRKGGFGSTGI